MKMEAIVFHGPDDIRVDTLEVPVHGEKDIVVKTRYSMVSSGTELRTLTGFYSKSSPFPLIPGYSAVGEVIAVGSDKLGYRVGDLVSYRNAKKVEGVSSCWGGQAGIHVETVDSSCTARPVILPQGSDLLDYAIVEVAAISLRGVEAANPKPSETAIVIGQGVIGAFSAAWLHLAGCRVIATDLQQSRLDRSAAWGVSFTVAGSGEEAEARVKAIVSGGADIVVESSGASSGALAAYRLLRKKPQSHGEPMAFYGGNFPRLVMQATYKNDITINPFDFVPGEGVTILAPKDRGVEDRQKVVEAIHQKKLNPAHFRDKVVSYKDAADAYKSLRDHPDENFSLIFNWSEK